MFQDAQTRQKRENDQISQSVSINTEISQHEEHPILSQSQERGISQQSINSDLGVV